MVLLGLFPVLPLKVLVARKVIRERMDYESYLGGRVKEELDGVAGLACGEGGAWRRRFRLRCATQSMAAMPENKNL